MRTEEIVLSITPISDDITENGYNFINIYVLPFFKGITEKRLINIYGYEVTCFNFQQVLQNNNVKYISFLGHGDKNNIYVLEAFFNVELEPLIDFKFPKDFKNKIYHFCSCCTGISLGEKLIKNGGIAFIGYTDIVGGEIDDESIFNEILMCDAQIDNTLSEGKSIEEAYNAAIEAYEMMANFYEGNGKLRWATLFRNHKNSLCSPVTDSKYGDKNARIY